MYFQVDSVKETIEMSLKIIRMYDWLLDLYVLDFFVDKHWEKLPTSWRICFQDLDPEYLGDIILGKPVNHVLPLSLLALVNAVKAIYLPRSSSGEHNEHLDVHEDTCAGHPRLKNLFLKHVKLKKRHEISLMAQVVNETASKSNCKAVIDFGSGLGHLVRILNYKYNLQAVGIECQNQLTEEARKLDKELEITASKHLSQKAMALLKQPIHLNITLSSLEQMHYLTLPESMATDGYGLIGLHPCGDLGPLLLKHFVNSKQVKFICLVGCCYMKLTREGYPMSDFVKGLDSHLSFISREIACHSIDVYCERLKKGNYEDLKVHAYRAALEKILVEHNPKLKHAQIRNVKNSNTMTFQKYCELALDKLNIDIPTDIEVWSETETLLEQWKRVVVVYSLRLALAPLVETLLLLDRLLYVAQHGLSCEIRPVFDPKLSPRNHIIVARRL